jgi:hypothetical protein
MPRRHTGGRGASRPGHLNPVGKLDGPYSQSGRFGEEKNLFPLPGVESRIAQTVSQSPKRPRSPVSRNNK